MKKMDKIVITKEELARIDKGAHRQALIDEGLYAIPIHKVHKNKKAYSRKKKHKNRED